MSVRPSTTVTDYTWLIQIYWFNQQYLLNPVLCETQLDFHRLCLVEVLVRPIVPTKPLYFQRCETRDFHRLRLVDVVVRPRVPTKPLYFQWCETQRDCNRLRLVVQWLDQEYLLNPCISRRLSATVTDYVWLMQW